MAEELGASAAQTGLSSVGSSPQAVSPTVAASIPSADTYRGWSVTWDYGYYTATSQNYDASWEGEEDGWVDNGQRVQGRTREAACAEVDAWYEENAS